MFIMDQQANTPSQPERTIQGLMFLILWNLIFVAVPVVLWFQPSPEPSIAKAVVLVVFAGPALWLAFIANFIYWFRQKPLSIWRLSFAMTFVAGLLTLVWTVAFFTVG